jgi:broad specificity phosphatase PhoE
VHASVFIDISLLRHGEAEGGARYRGVSDDPLSAHGREQMWTAVGDKCRWDSVVSSPLTRCADFANALAQHHALPLRIDARLREMDFGDWEGHSAEEIARRDGTALTRFWQDPWNHGPPRGEPLCDMRARVLAAWNDLVAERRSTLVITHGGPIRLLLCQAHGLPWARLLEIDVPLASLQRVLVPIASTVTPEALIT